jgi:hypothetical protein
MKKIPVAVYKTPEEIEAIIKEREAQAMLLPPGGARQSVLAEVMRLRSYAEMKRLLA